MSETHDIGEFKNPLAPEVPPRKFKNPYRISIKQWRAQEGLEDEDAYTERLTQIVCDSVCPAMCEHDCEVEPDGRCEHGCPSLLLAAGMI